MGEGVKGAGRRTQGSGRRVENEHKASSIELRGRSLTTY
jgi:hypothetical protein